jgi:hypothetical protein
MILVCVYEAVYAGVCVLPAPSLAKLRTAAARVFPLLSIRPSRRRCLLLHGPGQPPHGLAGHITVLPVTARYCRSQHGAVGHRTVLSATSRYCRSQHGTVGHRTVMSATARYCRPLHGTAGHCMVLPATARYCRPQHGIAGHSTVLPATAYQDCGKIALLTLLQ